ncbi:MAG: aminotransferase class IV [Defluviitaleaceae bacterium]|nr:aminotransferase class IV [Defluviitaleaceae bacterium]
MVITYFNGTFIDLDEKVIPIEERGHNFGDGIYDVIRVYNGKFFMLDAHLDRIFMSAEAIHLDLNRSRKALTNEFITCFEKSGETNADIYFQVTRGIATRNHLFPDCPVSLSIIVRPAKNFPTHETNAIMFHPDERWANCYIKSLNLLPNLLARQAAVSQGYVEAVLVKDGYVTEGSCTSVFIIKDGVMIVTPLSKQILSSITRMAVEKIASKFQIPIDYRHFTPDEMKAADEAFIVGTLIEITAVTHVEEVALGRGKVGEITKKLQQGFHELTLAG